jgi:hypothetical protein
LAANSLFFDFIKKIHQRSKRHCGSNSADLVYPFHPNAKNGKIRIKPKNIPPQTNTWNKPIKCPSKQSDTLFGD